MGKSYNFKCQNDGSKPQAIVSIRISEERYWWVECASDLQFFYLELWKIVIRNLRWISLMFWRCDCTYIWEKVANYSKCPQTSPYDSERIVSLMKCFSWAEIKEWKIQWTFWPHIVKLELCSHCQTSRLKLTRSVCNISNW